MSTVNWELEEWHFSVLCVYIISTPLFLISTDCKDRNNQKMSDDTTTTTLGKELTVLKFMAWSIMITDYYQSLHPGLIYATAGEVCACVHCMPVIMFYLCHRMPQRMLVCALCEKMPPFQTFFLPLCQQAVGRELQLKAVKSQGTRHWLPNYCQSTTTTWSCISIMQRLKSYKT